MVEPPRTWRPVRGTVEREPVPGTGIAEAFDQADRAMLVLGLPGSGKTTLLLRLADELLDRAEADADAPLPLFLELADWVRSNRQHGPFRIREAMNLQDIGEWAVQAAERAYAVGAGIVGVWLAERRLVLLFDGLDEVPESMRAECVRLLNELLLRCPRLALVVSSRSRSMCTSAGDFGWSTR
ncbi:NACHT domain-containing protein [Nonomuraea gerenzanensis]|uniref:NACHT domain-containing protein n=1 Tax=Nonomuraea gerenzanensis TaxID=93944 RepID=A0A1M4ERE0_9ACTN|nr:NACHT domain-containing protein [Nonomuraea gerenzanensis]UBU12838.1 NACHT domain-containing protein [Nonomuraea gerenzanensis]SBP01400.1 hypothetical protein BN4615_P10916 [Nonomuraea gerenzanensis]